MSVLFSVPSLFNLILFLKSWCRKPIFRVWPFDKCHQCQNCQRSPELFASVQTAVMTTFQFGFLAITNSGNVPTLLLSLPVQTPALPESRGQRSSPSPSTSRDL